RTTMKRPRRQGARAANLRRPGCPVGCPVGEPALQRGAGDAELAGDAPQRLSLLPTLVHLGEQLAPARLGMAREAPVDAVRLRSVSLRGGHRDVVAGGDRVGVVGVQHGELPSGRRSGSLDGWVVVAPMGAETASYLSIDYSRSS